MNQRGFFFMAVGSIVLMGLSACSGSPGSENVREQDVSGGAESIQTVNPVEELQHGITSIGDGYLYGPDTEGEPVEGGSFRWAAYAEPASLDPAVTIQAAATGGLEMLNIYDSITRWDVENQEFVPQTAERVEPNEEFDEWTVTIRQDITFSDGSKYDAEAVKASQERFLDMQGPETGLWNATIDEVEVVDSNTLVYRLLGPWRNFPSILSTGPGLIVAPSAGEGEDFKPVGAGPFELKEWESGESITLEARDDYWGGKPYLDEVVSVFLDDQEIAVDSLNQGSVDAVFALSPVHVYELVDQGYNAITNTANAGNSALINALEGMPGSDKRVRKAIQLAIDPEVVMERAYEGVIQGSSSLFPEWSQWASETPGPQPDPEEAERLLGEAKADGYDGKLEYIDGADPVSRNRALAVQAQLEAVGFEVELTLTRTIAERIQRIAVDRDYEMVAWSIQALESDPLPRFLEMLHSQGSQTFEIQTSEEMDRHISDFKAGLSHEEQIEAVAHIQQQINEEVPAIIWGQSIEILAWDQRVHGILSSSNSSVLLHKAWIDS